MTISRYISSWNRQQTKNRSINESSNKMNILCLNKRAWTFVLYRTVCEWRSLYSICKVNIDLCSNLVLSTLFWLRYKFMWVLQDLVVVFERSIVKVMNILFSFTEFRNVGLIDLIFWYNEEFFNSNSVKIFFLEDTRLNDIVLFVWLSTISVLTILV